MVVSLFAISLLVLTGVGFAAFTSSVTGTATFQAGTLTLGVISTSNTPAGGDGSPGPTCGVTSSPGLPGVATFTLTATNLYPGDNGCDFAVAIYNSGSLPATSLSVAYSGIGGSCYPAIASSGCYYLNDFLGVTPATGEVPASNTPTPAPSGDVAVPAGGGTVPGVSLSAGGTIYYTGYLNMFYCSAIVFNSPYTCNNAQGTTDTITVTIAGSVGT